ncbi:adenylate kinase [Actinokineospora sp.]|uniref:adenylate kinase n=1 Tax=Actinokineospora sp. TaxID=1872133 RepID=UPI0040381546
MSGNSARKAGVLDRVVILGTCGSGKSTLAARLAERTGAAHIELDGLHHGPDWTPTPVELFRARVGELTERRTWIVDGNYIDALGDLLWHRADTVVWLDLPLRVILRRVVRRSLGRIILRTELWNGNRETLGSLFGKESLVTWAIGSHRRHRGELPLRLAPPRLTGVSVVRLRSSAEVNRWLASLPEQ